MASNFRAVPKVAEVAPESSAENASVRDEAFLQLQLTDAREKGNSRSKMSNQHSLMLTTVGGAMVLSPPLLLSLLRSSAGIRADKNV